MSWRSSARLPDPRPRPHPSPWLPHTGGPLKAARGGRGRCGHCRAPLPRASAFISLPGHHGAPASVLFFPRLFFWSVLAKGKKHQDKGGHSVLASRTCDRQERRRAPLLNVSGSAGTTYQCVTPLLSLTSPYRWLWWIGRD